VFLKENSNLLEPHQNEPIIIRAEKSGKEMALKIIMELSYFLKLSNADTED